MFAALAVITPSFLAILRKTDAHRATQSILCRTGVKYVSEEERTALARRIAEAGLDLDPALFAGLRLSLIAVGIILLLPLTLFYGADFFWLVFLVPLLYFLPNIWLNEKAEDRKTAIRLSLSDFSALFSVALVAGADTVTALQEAGQSIKGPLSEEVDRAVQESLVGRHIVNTLEDMTERCNVGELRSLVQAVVQSYRYGAPLAEAVREYAVQMRFTRRHEIMDAAGKLTIKMSLVIAIFMLMPSLSVVLYPSGVTLLKAFGN